MKTRPNDSITSSALLFLNSDKTNLDAHICHLGNAEDALQRAAYDDDNFSYMFRYAYELKQLREEFMKLQEILGYETERESPGRHRLPGHLAAGIDPAEPQAVLPLRTHFIHFGQFVVTTRCLFCCLEVLHL
jgi:hypothetical protein